MYGVALNMRKFVWFFNRVVVRRILKIEITRSFFIFKNAFALHLGRRLSVCMLRISDTKSVHYSSHILFSVHYPLPKAFGINMWIVEGCSWRTNNANTVPTTLAVAGLKKIFISNNVFAKFSIKCFLIIN